MFAGGVPKGCQDRNAKKHAIQSNGPNPEKNDSKQLNHNWRSLGGEITFEPFSCRLLITATRLSPLDALKVIVNLYLISKELRKSVVT